MLRILPLFTQYDIILRNIKLYKFLVFDILSESSLILKNTEILHNFAATYNFPKTFLTIHCSWFQIVDTTSQSE